jgi:hypothetical protein
LASLVSSLSVFKSLLFTDSSDDGFRKNCGADVGAPASTSLKAAVVFAALVGILVGVGFSASSIKAEVGVEGGDFGVSICGSIGISVDGAATGD